MKFKITESDIIQMASLCANRLLSEGLAYVEPDPADETPVVTVPETASTQETSIQTQNMTAPVAKAQVQNVQPQLAQAKTPYPAVNPQAVASDTMPKARKVGGKWNYANKRTRSFGYNDYGGMCAHGVGITLGHQFGIQDYVRGGIGNGGVNVAKNPKFTHVARVNANSGYPQAQPGDVGVFRGKMHAVIYLGNGVWSSDTVQRRMNCFGKWNGNVDIYRPNPPQGTIAEGLSRVEDDNVAINMTDYLPPGTDTSTQDVVPAVQTLMTGETQQSQNTIAQTQQTPDKKSKQVRPSEQRRIAKGGLDEKAIYVMKRLTQDLQMPQCSAAAMCGIIMCESGFQASAFNKGERNGTLKSSGACAGRQRKNEPHNSKYAYGAGLIQWTFWPRKTRVLKYIGKDENFLMKQGIESVPFDTQVTMIEKELQSSQYNNILTGLQKMTNVDEATKLLFCNFVGGYSNKEAYDPNRLAKLTKAYHKGCLDKRLRYARYFNDLSVS